MLLGIEELKVYKSKRKKLDNSLLTNVIGREKEIKDIISFLNDNDYIAISGPAGIGKSRFAVAVIDEYKKNNPDVISLVANDYGSPTNALDSIITSDKKYILFIDDADTINFKELFNYIKHNNDGNIKVVITIRNYLCEFIKDEMEINFYSLKELPNELIKKAIESNTDIKNPKWLDQIVKIANGNIRVAFLASKEAIKDEKGFMSLFNQSDVLNKYYKDEIALIDSDEELIITAGIIAFFRSVYLEQLFYVAPILKSICLSKKDFVRNVNTLIRKEIVDEYKNVVKISDQCFADYLLNYVIVKKRYLRIKDLLLIGFKYYKNKIIDSIKTIIYVYNSESFIPYLKDELILACNELNTNLSLKIQIEEIFSNIIPEYVLVDFKKEIENYNDRRDLEWIKNIFLSLSNTDFCEVVAEGMFKVLKKTKEKKDIIYKAFSDAFKMSDRAINNCFKNLSLFINLLEKYEVYNDNTFKIVSEYIKYGFQFDEWASRKGIRHCSFNVDDRLVGIKELRKKAWNYIFKFEKEKVYDAIIIFVKHHFIDNTLEIVKNDLMCINNYLTEEDVVINTIIYAKLYQESLKYGFESLLRPNEKYKDLFSILLGKRNIGQDYDEYEEEYNSNVLDYYTNNKGSLCEMILEIEPLFRKYFGDKLKDFFKSVLKCMDSLDISLIKIFIDSDLYAYDIIECLMKFYNPKDVYDVVIGIADKAKRDEFLYNFYTYLGVYKIDYTNGFVEWLNSKYDENTRQSSFRRPADLKYIASKCEMSFSELVKVIFKKNKYNSFIAHVYLDDFMYDRESFKMLLEENQKLAIDVYEFILENDHNGFACKMLEDILIANKNYCKRLASLFIKSKDSQIEDYNILLKEDYYDVFLKECLKLLTTNDIYVPYSIQQLVKNNISHKYIIDWFNSYIISNYRNDKAMEILFRLLDDIPFDFKKSFLLEYYKNGVNNEILKIAIIKDICIYSDAKAHFSSKITQLKGLKKEFLKWNYIDQISVIDSAINNYESIINQSEINNIFDASDYQNVNELFKADFKTDISLKDAFELYCNNEEFRNMLSSGYACYKDGCFVNQSNEPLKFEDYLNDKRIVEIRVKEEDDFRDYVSKANEIVDTFKLSNNLSLCDCLLKLFKEKEWDAKRFQEETFQSRDLFSKIKNGKKNHLDKRTLVAILIGLKLTKKERDYLLELNGTQLSSYNLDDQLYSFFLNSGMEITDACDILNKLEKENFTKNYW